LAASGWEEEKVYNLPVGMGLVHEARKIEQNKRKLKWPPFGPIKLLWLHPLDRALALPRSTGNRMIHELEGEARMIVFAKQLNTLGDPRPCLLHRQDEAIGCLAAALW